MQISLPRRLLRGKPVTFSPEGGFAAAAGSSVSATMVGFNAVNAPVWSAAPTATAVVGQTTNTNVTQVSAGGSTITLAWVSGRINGALVPQPGWLSFIAGAPPVIRCTNPPDENQDITDMVLTATANGQSVNSSAGSITVNATDVSWTGTEDDAAVSFTQGVAGQTYDLTQHVTNWDADLYTMSQTAGSSLSNAGITLSSAGVLSYNGTSGTNIIGGVQVTIADTASQEWASRTAGTLWATRFSTQSEMRGDYTKTESSADFYKNYIVTTSGATGTNDLITWVGSGGLNNGPFMRQLYPGSLAQNPGGWRRMFIDGATQWPKNTYLYLSYTFRLPSSKFSLSGLAAQYKTSIIAGYGRSGYGATYQGAELTQSNISNRLFFFHYTNAGESLASYGFPTGDSIRYQNQVDRGSGTNAERYCLYGGAGIATAGCYDYLPNTWMTLYYVIRPLSSGNVDLEIYCQYEGDAGYTLLERYINYGQWSGSDLFNTITITAYTTGRTAGSAPDTYMDVGEVICSASPIPPRTIWS